MPKPSFPTLALCALAFSLQPTLAMAEEGMQWQFYEDNDPGNEGATTARLVYGVPETDNVQVMGVCESQPSTGARSPSLTFGANIGDLANGKEASLRFSGGGFEQTLDGHVVRAEGEGLNGVQIEIKNDDPLWATFTEKESLDYAIPGYRAITLELTGGRDNLKKFIEACRTYETAAVGSETDAANEPAEASGDAQKAAFDSAKELGTIAAFEAFLSSYPDGFYADLARAYVDKLKAADAPEETDEASPPAPSPKPKTAAAPGPDPSCKELFKVKSQGSDSPAKITFVNKSGMYRSIMWLDFGGRPKEYANLQAGEEVTLDTFESHPWMVTDGPGDCIEIYMPHAGTRVVTLTAPDGSVAAPPPPAKKQAAPAPKPAPQKKAAPKCRSRSILVDGKCILKRNAAGYCGPGYHVKNGKCVSGAYVAPKKPQRSTHGCPPGQVWSPQELCHYDD